jgi:hypothetical protein
MILEAVIEVEAWFIANNYISCGDCFTCSFIINNVNNETWK